MDNKDKTIDDSLVRLLFVGVILFPWLVLGLIFGMDRFVLILLIDGIPIVLSIIFGWSLFLKKYYWGAVFLAITQYVVAIYVGFIAGPCMGDACGLGTGIDLFGSFIYFSILLVVTAGIGITIDHIKMKNYRANLSIVEGKIEGEHE